MIVQITIILREELNEIKQLLKQYDEENYPKINRFGLPIFEKNELVQKYEYVSGLYYANVDRKPDKAIEKLIQAIARPEKLCHSVSKKTMILMSELASQKLKKLMSHTDRM